MHAATAASRATWAQNRPVSTGWRPGSAPPDATLTTGLTTGPTTGSTTGPTTGSTTGLCVTASPKAAPYSRRAARRRAEQHTVKARDQSGSGPGPFRAATFGTIARAITTASRTRAAIQRARNGGVPANGAVRARAIRTKPKATWSERSRPTGSAPFHIRRWASGSPAVSSSVLSAFMLHRSWRRQVSRASHQISASDSTGNSEERPRRRARSSPPAVASQCSTLLGDSSPADCQPTRSIDAPVTAVIRVPVRDSANSRCAVSSATRSGGVRRRGPAGRGDM